MGKVVQLKGFGRKAVAETTKKLSDENCRESGIKPEVFSKLGWEVVDKDRVWDLLYPKKKGKRPSSFTGSGYAIWYYGPDGKRLNYFRIRKLSGSWDNGKSKVKDDRYKQRSNSLPHIFIPWQLVPPTMIKDGKLVVSGPLVVTEGEKKAVEAWRCDIPCIGLGGVDSYQSSKHQMYLLDELLEWIDWSNVLAEVCFDSDVYNSEAARDGMRRFMYAARRKLKPKALAMRRLTSEDHERTALDEFLASFGEGNEHVARSAYFHLKPVEDQLSEHFARFDSELVYVESQETYFSLKRRQYFVRGKTGVLSEYAVGDTVMDSDGKPEFPINLWLTGRDVARTTVRSVVFAPGEPDRFVAETNANGDVTPTLNLWRPGLYDGEKPDPDPKPVRKFLRYIEYLTPELTHDQREYLLNWLAYPLQRIGSKTDVTLVLVSKEQGTGKSTLRRIMFRMYGKHNCKLADVEDLKSSFNDAVFGVSFVAFEEAHVGTFAEAVLMMSKLKFYTTEESFSLKRKFMTTEDVPNHMNIMVTSNHPTDALRLDPEDRRMFVVQAPEATTKWPKEKFIEFCAWLDKGGYRKIYRFLMGRDLTEFNPRESDAPKTAARLRMIEGGSYTVLDDLVNVLVTEPREILKADQDLYTPEAIIKAINNYAAKSGRSQPKLTSHMLGGKTGMRSLPKVSFLNTRGQRITLYAVHNREKWKAAKDKAWIAQYRQDLSTKISMGTDERDP